MLNPVGVFQHHLGTPIFMVYPKPGYRGIEKFVIPEGCALETDISLQSVCLQMYIYNVQLSKKMISFHHLPCPRKVIIIYVNIYKSAS
jgi:hypothetical protein